MNKNLVTSTVTVVAVIFVALFLINLFHISYPISVTTSNISTELSVVGEGKVDVIPDTGTVNLGITVDAKPTVAEVKNTLDQTNNAIVVAMQKLGIQKEDIKTQDYSISPNYEYVDNQNKQSGYTGSVNMSIKVRKTDLVSKVIEGATTAGANQVQGTNYSVENPAKYREQARDKAIANAKEQAQKLASSLGIHLGKITNIVESTSYDGGPVPMYDKAMSASAGLGSGPALQPGSQTISSVVTLYFQKN